MNDARVVIETVRAHTDPRGALFEPLDDEGLAQQHNVHVVLTRPNEVRGNHWHRVAWETTAVVGPCHVRWKDDDGVHDLQVPAREVRRLRIPPGVVHAYRNTGVDAMVLVSFSSIPHDPGGSDTVRETIL